MTLEMTENYIGLALKAIGNPVGLPASNLPASKAKDLILGLADADSSKGRRLSAWPPSGNPQPSKLCQKGPDESDYWK
jgi:hypothetical protein